MNVLGLIVLTLAALIALSSIIGAAFADEHIDFAHAVAALLVAFGLVLIFAGLAS